MFNLTAVMVNVLGCRGWVPEVDGGHSRDATEADDDSPDEVQVEDGLVLDLVLEGCNGNEGDDGACENAQALHTCQVCHHRDLGIYSHVS